ncbi:MAG: hypothetical protein ACTHMM_21305 [Agriterribacter sp.]
MQVETIQEAKKIAKETSKDGGYACVILSMGKYYVETETPFIRNHEALIAEYSDGILIDSE